jgi:hypothetical protein
LQSCLVLTKTILLVNSKIAYYLQSCFGLTMNNSKKKILIVPNLQANFGWHNSFTNETDFCLNGTKKEEQPKNKTASNMRFAAIWADRMNLQLLFFIQLQFWAGRYKFGLWINNQRYCNHQLQLRADEFLIPKLQQAVFVTSNFRIVQLRCNNCLVDRQNVVWQILQSNFFYPFD